MNLNYNLIYFNEIKIYYNYINMKGIKFNMDSFNCLLLVVILVVVVVCCMKKHPENFADRCDSFKQEMEKEGWFSKMCAASIARKEANEGQKAQCHSNCNSNFITRTEEYMGLHCTPGCECPRQSATKYCKEARSRGLGTTPGPERTRDMGAVLPSNTPSYGGNGHYPQHRPPSGGGGFGRGGDGTDDGYGGGGGGGGGYGGGGFPNPTTSTAYFSTTSAGP
jgi:hypothetical protein